jgi:ABC-type sugar transport system ATPase subunit
VVAVTARLRWPTCSPIRAQGTPPRWPDHRVEDVRGRVEEVGALWGLVAAPESLVIAANGDEGFGVTVPAVEELGSDAFVHGTFGAEEQVVDSPDVIARIDPTVVPARGSRIKLRIKPGTIHLFDATTGDRIET